ncbi:MAG: T9SS type A sorting domain-containing protein [Dysgonamonadaceae bacterium]|jgi:hypothetical protein|nr:T9SS type A sorting domain-containing protein [Dysgonamonadaceae bacterium]
MNKKIFTLLFTALLSFNMSSHAKNVLIDVNVGDYPDFAQWNYFSFTSGEIVGAGDFTLTDVQGNIGIEVPDAAWAARTDWDIAFHGSDIRTNGAGALLIADKASSSTSLDEIYANLTQAPANGYEADKLLTGTFYQRLFPMPPVRATQLLACGATNGWAALGMSGNSVNPVVVVFKLANGKYVKVYLKEFFDEEGKGGFIDMEYAEIPASGNSGITNPDGVKFSVYPNPATTVLNVELTGYTSDAEITIYNLSGVVVKRIPARTGVNTVSVNDLPGGIYFVKTNNQVQKLIKK